MMKKVARKQVTCNQVLAKWEKQNLGTNLLTWKRSPEPADTLISEMFKTHGQIQLPISQLK